MYISKWLLIGLVTVVLTSACRSEGGRTEAGSGGPARDTSSAQAAQADSSANRFDPATLAPGDSFLGLEVASVEVARTAFDSTYVGTVAFKGPIPVTGTFGPHFDSEVEERCFFAGDAAAHALPRFFLDERIPWFCFSNREKVDELLNGRTGIRATIVIDDYRTTRSFTDAYDTARFVRLVRWEE